MMRFQSFLVIKKVGLVMTLFHEEETERTKGCSGYGTRRRQSSTMWSGNPGINGTEFLSAFSESLVSSFDEDLCIVILQTEA